MVDARKQAALVKMGDAIQRRQVTLEKLVQRLSDELANFKAKAVLVNYVPDDMPDVSIPIDAATKADMLQLAVKNEAALRAVVDDLNAFIAQVSV